MEGRRTRRALAAQVRDQVEAFVERLEAETGPVVLYVGDDFAAKFGLPKPATSTSTFFGPRRSLNAVEPCAGTALRGHKMHTVPIRRGP